MLSTLNGESPSWADIETTIAIPGGQTLQTIDYKSIDWDSDVKEGEQRGASGGRKMKGTTGEKTDGASAVFYKSGMKALKRALMAVAPKDSAGRPKLSLVRFNIVVKHSVGDDPDIHVVKLLGCRLLKNAEKHAEGTDPNTVECTLNPLEIVEVIDGVDTVLL